jgi:proteic killer suppression protein
LFKVAIGEDCLKQTKVILTRKAAKDLRSVPTFIQDKLLQWVDQVQEFGLRETRKIPGYHDEPLQGDRSGQ